MKVFDLHCDTATKCYDERAPFVQNGFEISLEQASLFEQWVQCFAIFIPDGLRGAAAYTYYKNVLAYIKEQSGLSFARRPQELRQQLQSGQGPSVLPILTVEGGAVLAGNLKNCEALARDGVRMLTLTWNGENELGYGIEEDKGLKPLGFAAVRELERLGIVVDVSHLSESGFYDVAKTATRPFVASHSCAKALCGHPRNLTDDQFGVIRDSHGLVGINYNQAFLRDSGPATIQDILCHIDHFLQLGGEHVIALGSDFDGAYMPEDLKTAAALPQLYEAMLAHGYKQSLVWDIFYNNAVHFFVRQALAHKSV
ncbi:dipeptidase [Neobittarella massiliensis]|uniref:Membrane dipeptidase n=1 Tax=Neobittarella massiliensis (ex Bilen et al. 2018) TaxID=2041842 RepID=A0A8J6IPH3_9FIRM|nr:membrane dipeptidase [Neobittarella massiliensis]MBC3515811.1 membrane dipeptidase [Neobittarella massiliensis]